MNKLPKKIHPGKYRCLSTNNLKEHSGICESAHGSDPFPVGKSVNIKSYPQVYGKIPKSTLPDAKHNCAVLFLRQPYIQTCFLIDHYCQTSIRIFWVPRRCPKMLIFLQGHKVMHIIRNESTAKSETFVVWHCHRNHWYRVVYQFLSSLNVSYQQPPTQLFWEN